MQDFPYSNLHQLNLDWIIETVQKLDSTLEFIDNLTSTDINHGLSANMGRVLRTMIEQTREMINRTISSFAGEYNLTDLFLPGDVVINNGKFYRAIAETSGAFHPEDWVELTDILHQIMSESEYINQSIIDLWQSISDRYDSDTQYSSGAFCWRGDAEIHLYRSLRSTTGQFNLNDWEEVAVTDLISTSGVQSVNGKTGTVVLDSDDVGALSAATTLSEIPGDSQHRTVTDSEKSAWNGKQNALVSGTNIKTINQQSILGSGNIDISGGTGDHTQLSNRNVADQHPISAITNLQSTLDGKQAQLVSGTNIKTINQQSLLGSGNINIQSGGASFDDIFPVGSFWWNSATTSSPAGLGLSAGTWEQITDKFILAAGIVHAANSTGGEETHRLGANEIPPHRHSMEIFTSHGSGNLPGGVAGYYYDNPSGSEFRTDYTPREGTQQSFSIMPPYLAAYCWHRVT